MSVGSVNSSHAQIVNTYRSTTNAPLTPSPQAPQETPVPAAPRDSFQKQYGADSFTASGSNGVSSPGEGGGGARSVVSTTGSGTGSSNPGAGGGSTMNVVGMSASEYVQGLAQQNSIPTVPTV